MGKNRKSSAAAAAGEWKDLNYDMLLKIFMALNVVDFSAASMVCNSWRDACRDVLLRNGRVLDISKWKDARFRVSAKAIAVLISLLNLSSGQLDCLIFHFTLYIGTRDLINVASRSRNLKRLVLPLRFSGLTKEGINVALQQWEGLESLTITTTFVAPHFLEAIGKYCPKFSELKLACHLTLKIARTLAKNVPKLKVLSLQSVRINKHALVYMVRQLKQLEVLNVSHGFIVSGNRPETTVVYPQHTMPTLLERIPRKPPTLLHCKGHCVVCREVFSWNMSNRWRGIGVSEQIWRQDMIPTLQVGE